MGEKVDLHIGGYHLTEAIGTGGMGSVFRATVETDDKPVARGSTVAVKLLHPHLRTVTEFVKRFHREARLAAKIDHPNVIRVLDEGVDDDRHHYIVMELAEGMKLSDLMADGRPLSSQQTIEIMHQVCDALTAAGSIDDPDEPVPCTFCS